MRRTIAWTLAALPPLALGVVAVVMATGEPGAPDSPRATDGGGSEARCPHCVAESEKVAAKVSTPASEPVAVPATVAAPGSVKVSPVALGSVDSFDVFTHGNTIHVLAGANADDMKSATFRHTRSDDGGATWTKPVVVSDGAVTPVAHHRGSDARIVADGDKLFAAWTTPGSGFKGTGPMGTAISTDGGRTWKPGANPADHESTGSHRFLALTEAGGVFHLIWLDDRNDLRGLRHALSSDGGATWSVNATIDEFTCACCWNELLHVPSHDAKSPGTLFALYRDMKPSDMGLARSEDGGKTWRKRGHVGAFKWDFDGCPHVGGALAALAPEKNADAGPALFAVVWTGHGDDAGCHLLRSAPGGDTFEPLRRVGGPTAKMIDIASDASGVLAVTWDEVDQDDRAVFVMTSRDRGQTWSIPQRLSAATMQASHPRVVVLPAGGFRVFYTQTKGAGAAEWVVAEVK